MALPCSTIDCLNEVCTLLYNDFYSYQSQTDKEINGLYVKNEDYDDYFNQIYVWANGGLRNELNDIKDQISDNKTEVNGYINAIYTKIDNIDSYINNLQQQISDNKTEVNGYINEIYTKIDNIDSNINNLQQQISDNKTEVNGYINEIYTKIDNIDSNINNFNNKLSEIKKVLQNYRSEN